MTISVEDVGKGKPQGMVAVSQMEADEESTWLDDQYSEHM